MTEPTLYQAAQAAIDVMMAARSKVIQAAGIVLAAALKRDKDRHAVSRNGGPPTKATDEQIRATMDLTAAEAASQLGCSAPLIYYRRSKLRKADEAANSKPTPAT